MIQRHSIVIAVLLGLLFVVSPANAQSPPTTVPAFTGNNPGATSTLVRGRADVSTITCTQAFSITTAACGDASYAANQCLSGNCACINWSCTERNAIAGNGNATVEIGIDIDDGQAGAPADCYPFFGQFDTTSADPETTDFSGAICDPNIAKSTTATVTGAWQLVAANTSKVTDGAGGTLTGTLNLTNGLLKLKLKGRTF